MVFHYPGSDPLAGDHRGKAEVLALLGRVMEMTAGRFHPEVHDILASDDHVAALVTVRVERKGRRAVWRA